MTADEKPMDDSMNRLFAEIEDMRESASVNAVFGQPVTVGERTVIPIASVTYAVGFGFGEGQDQVDAKQAAPGEKQPGPGGGSGAGGGGMVRARPLAVAEITPEGTRIEGIVNEQTISLAGILMAAWSVFWVAAAIMRMFRRK